MPNFQGNWVDPVANDGKDRSHVLALPYWTLFLRVAQAVIALLELILTAYAASQLGSDVAGFGLTWFTFIFTLFYFIWLGVSLVAFPTAYHPFAHLPVEILLNIFWLCSWAVLASEAASVGDFEDFFGRFIPRRERSALDCVKAAAGIGALEWILFTVSLVFVVLSFVNYTNTHSGGHVEGGAASEAKQTELHNFGGAGVGAGAGVAAAGAQPAPDNGAPAGYPQQGYPQQGYPQQGYPQQGYPQQGYAAQQSYVDPQQQQQQQQQAPYPTQDGAGGYPQAYPQQGYAAQEVPAQHQQQPMYEQPPQQQYQQQPVAGTPPPQAPHPTA